MNDALLLVLLSSCKQTIGPQGQVKNNEENKENKTMVIFLLVFPFSPWMTFAIVLDVVQSKSLKPIQKPYRPVRHPEPPAP